MQNVIRESPASGSAPFSTSTRSSARSNVPDWRHSSTIPTSSPTSPALVIQNALTAARAASGLWYPEPDKEIRAEPDELPADEELDEVGREDQAHHRKREERLIGVVAAERRRRLIAQVAQRVHLHETGDQRDEREHDRRLGIGEDADGRQRLPLGR